MEDRGVAPSPGECAAHVPSCDGPAELTADALMVLDPATLGVAFVLLSTVLGALLLFAWTLNRKVTALAWWSSTFCLSAIGLGLVSLGQGTPGPLLLLVANAIVMLGYGALYVGCRIFNGRSDRLWIGLVGVAIWALAFPVIRDWAGTRLVFASWIVGSYAGLSAWELWRHAPQRLASQWVAVGLLLGLGTFNLLRGMLGFSLGSVTWIGAFRSRWSSEMALFLVVYGPTMAFIFLSMAKERMEFDYKQAALIDPLTGVPNRRAFMQNADDLLRGLGGAPASCLLFDLDNFKSLNDRYGHDAGDRILIVFGRVLADHLPKRTFGRLGGEEFGAVLPLSCREATVLAETVRQAFRSAGEAVLGRRADVTVSVGCATATRAAVEDLMQRADAALYEAKAGGRNIVVTA